MTLTRQRADCRSQWIQVGSIDYDFHLILNEGQQFHGLAELSFVLTSIDFEYLPIDFSCKKVLSLQVNNHAQEADVSQDRFLLIHNRKVLGKRLLHKGKNRITVLYSGQYDTNGEGCVTYTETTDKGKKNQYLYTQFEAYCANMVFPCFDQPNLKAPMKLTIVAPSIWKILSNETAASSTQFSEKHYQETNKLHAHSRHLLPRFLESVPKNYEGKYISTIFPPTKVLPTYLYCFIAGDYQQIVCPLAHSLPFQLSIYSISSYRPYLENLSKFIFDVTIESMKFYEQFFGYPYSFPKFDQVWVHEFRAGAMQNAGIVTYNDRDLYKEKNPTSVQLIELADTITHQLSHHWFGNLVTMRWWDDLWLNQSFADFISYFCIEKIKDKLQYKVQSAMSLFRDREVWGYREDLRNTTTHPIRAEVLNTAQTQSIFDGITYSKGGACLQQLMFLMGEANFSKSLSNYFNRFQWSNASIDDFLEEMSYNFSEKEFTLDQWKQMWLMTASLNVFQVDCQQEGDNLKINVSQGVNCPRYNTLRFRRTEVALFNSKAQMFETISLLIHPVEKECFQQKVSQSVAAILYNHNDQDFSQNIIDSRSLAFFQDNILKIDSLLTRTNLWYNLRSMTERALYPLQKFTELIDKFLFDQKVDFLFQNILTRLRLSINQNLPSLHRTPSFSLIFKHLYVQLSSNKPQSEERLNILQNQLIAFASAEQEIVKLKDWLEGRDKNLASFELDISRKWSIGRKVFTLKTFTLDQKQSIFDSIAKVDDSDKKTEQKHVFDALTASKVHFQELYKKLKSDKGTPMSVKQLIAAGWKSRVHQDWLSTQYRERYFKDLLELSGELCFSNFQFFYRTLKPIDDDMKGQIECFWRVIKALQGMNDESGELKVHAKEMKKIVDDLQKRKDNYKFNTPQSK